VQGRYFWPCPRHLGKSTPGSGPHSKFRVHRPANQEDLTDAPLATPRSDPGMTGVTVVAFLWFIRQNDFPVVIVSAYANSYAVPR